MNCNRCNELLIGSEIENNPEVPGWGRRTYSCPEHPQVVEITEWFCPYIPLVNTPTVDLASTFKTKVLLINAGAD